MAAAAVMAGGSPCTVEASAASVPSFEDELKTILADMDNPNIEGWDLFVETPQTKMYRRQRGTGNTGKKKTSLYEYKVAHSVCMSLYLEFVFQSPSFVCVCDITLLCGLCLNTMVPTRVHTCMRIRSLML